MTCAPLHPPATRFQPHLHVGGTRSSLKLLEDEMTHVDRNSISITCSKMSFTHPKNEDMENEWKWQPNDSQTLPKIPPNPSSSHKSDSGCSSQQCPVPPSTASKAAMLRTMAALSVALERHREISPPMGWGRLVGVWLYIRWKFERIPRVVFVEIHLLLFYAEAQSKPLHCKWYCAQGPIVILSIHGRQERFPLMLCARYGRNVKDHHHHHYHHKPFYFSSSSLQNWCMPLVEI